MTAEERFERIERNLESVTQIQREQTAEIEKQNEGIKSLIVVARTVLTAVQELRTRTASWLPHFGSKLVWSQSQSSSDSSATVSLIL
jgi:hypothetical protein